MTDLEKQLWAERGPVFYAALLDAVEIISELEEYGASIYTSNKLDRVRRIATNIRPPWEDALRKSPKLKDATQTP